MVKMVKIFKITPKMVQILPSIVQIIPPMPIPRTPHVVTNPHHANIATDLIMIAILVRWRHLGRQDMVQGGHFIMALMAMIMVEGGRLTEMVEIASTTIIITMMKGTHLMITEIVPKVVVVVH